MPASSNSHNQQHSLRRVISAHLALVSSSIRWEGRGGGAVNSVIKAPFDLNIPRRTKLLSET